LAWQLTVGTFSEIMMPLSLLRADRRPRDYDGAVTVS
jgi:hypothetical protein